MELQTIKQKIHEIRGQKVMLDFDLAELYEVPTKALKQAVRRNIERFPEDFMFRISKEEKNQIILQFVHLNNLKFSSVLPMVFTEHGAVMLASIINSERAIETNIQIVRVFTNIRQMLFDNSELRYEIEKIKKKVDNHSKNIELVFQYLDELLEKKVKPRRLIGFKIPKKN